jgi:hypothetical protein
MNKSEVSSKALSSQSLASPIRSKYGGFFRVVGLVRVVALASSLAWLVAGCSASEGAIDGNGVAENPELDGSEAVATDEQAAIKFDDCCVDLSGVIDCRGRPNAPTCTRYRASGTRKFYCSAQKKTVTCRDFKAYRCASRGMPYTSSMPCCSGNAAYNGSELSCL